MAADPTRLAETQAWLDRAAADVRAAEHGLRATPPLLEDVLFHCQQAVEKSLKAFLAWHDRPFRKTHDLVEIGQACVELDGALDPLLRRAAPLTEYAWRFRYPGEPEEPDREEALAALSLAREVGRAIAGRLPEELAAKAHLAPKETT